MDLGDGRTPQERALRHVAARSRGPAALELQSGEVRIVLGRDQRPCQADVHDAARHHSTDEPVTVEPMQAFPPIRDLVTDVSWNYEVKKKHQAVQAAEARCARRHVADAAGRRRPRTGIPEVHRVLPLPGRLPRPARPPQARRVHRSALPCLRRRARDASARHRGSGRRAEGAAGIGFCNITKCCTKVCPEHITITDNAIIPLKERVVDEFYDPLTRLFRIFKG